MVYTKKQLSAEAVFDYFLSKDGGIITLDYEEVQSVIGSKDRQVTQEMVEGTDIDEVIQGAREMIEKAPCERFILDVSGAVHLPMIAQIAETERDPEIMFACSYEETETLRAAIYYLTV